ncbi:periplasmic ABC transporter substrate-binding component [Caballeronia hypogeia]|uniref:Periplasmic ABC transporter substrate-binding component n=1 Tax=Caballeronia hypogeia TaxID=1777140 RepID=A0A158CW07_9BURK|nr:sugar ABC transporter substrate-binding protein [Caballeronia hypogeia]SAK86518.1 periplasmic ABC transporter substrate-binding component [Caballeronia hypogeia]
MRAPIFRIWSLSKLKPLAFAAASFALCAGAHAETITIGSVNNPDMIELQKLSPAFEKANPDIKLKFVFLEENVLRQRVTTDIATKSGQFDVMMIGTYEAPIWGQRGWLTPISNLPASYDLEDVIKTVRDSLSYKGTLYALPFDAESSMTYYRKDLFAAKGLTMPPNPTYQQVADFAAKLDDKKNGVYGICLRGKAGWGENMGYLGTLVNSFGGRYFDMQWRPEIDTPEWHNAITYYVNLMTKYGPPGATSNGFNENLTLMMNGKCAMWVDSTVAAGMLYDKKQSSVAEKLGYANAPHDVTTKGSHWLWSWALAIPVSSKQQDAAKKFITWATSKDYIKLAAADVGWALVPPGTRKSTYDQPDYQKAAPFASFVLNAVQTADPLDSTLKKVPYTGTFTVNIPEFQSIGTIVGQQISGALSGSTSVDQALKAGQAAALRQVVAAGYVKD